MITSGYGRSASDTPHPPTPAAQLQPAAISGTSSRIGAVPVPANGHTTSPHTRCAQAPTPINFDHPPIVAEDNVSATLTVAVPAARVFAVLADPATHSAIDGTGWVQEAVDRAPLAEVGQVFRMDMYHPNHPDGDYRVANKV